MGDRQACLDLEVKSINMEVVNKDLMSVPKRDVFIFTGQELGSGC